MKKQKTEEKLLQIAKMDIEYIQEQARKMEKGELDIDQFLDLIAWILQKYYSQTKEQLTK